MYMKAKEGKKCIHTDYPKSKNENILGTCFMFVYINLLLVIFFLLKYVEECIVIILLKVLIISWSCLQFSAKLYIWLINFKLFTS